MPKHQIVIHWQDECLAKVFSSEEYLWEFETYGIVIKNKETPNSLIVYPWTTIEAVTLEEEDRGYPRD